MLWVSVNACCASCLNEIPSKKEREIVLAQVADRGIPIPQ